MIGNRSHRHNSVCQTVSQNNTNVPVESIARKSVPIITEPAEKDTKQSRRQESHFFNTPMA